MLCNEICYWNCLSLEKRWASTLLSLLMKSILSSRILACLHERAWFWRRFGRNNGSTGSDKRLGVEDRFFRFEGRRSDRVYALPAYLESSRLRLYCLCISSKVLVLGNGGLKESRTYQEDPYLNKCVETLQKIDFEIRQRENRKEITVRGTQLHGALTFYIND